MRAAIACALALVACGVAEPAVVGKWQNGTNQLLEIRADLTGYLTQSATCSPTLEIAAEQDPYGAIALRFEPHQRVFFPKQQQPSFRARSFCSSTGTKPMCNFCRVEGTRMTCSSTEQEIIGSGVRVIHDCNWLAVMTTTTSTVPLASCGPAARVASCTDGQR